MPTRAGIPLAAIPGGPLNPVNWLDIGGNEVAGLQQAPVMRGKPQPLAWWQRRPRLGPETIPQPNPVYFTSRPYSRGADAHAPKFGQVATNPIGAGIYAPYRLPTIAGPGARYTFGAIWFGVQALPTSVRMNPTIPIETMNALISTSTAFSPYITTG